AVRAKLKELNPFFGDFAYKEVGGKIAEMEIGDPPTDLTPLQALTELKTLVLFGPFEGRSHAVDFAALRSLRLLNLALERMTLHDLGALRGMRLHSLNLNNATIVDPSALKEIALTELYIE